MKKAKNEIGPKQLLYVQIYNELYNKIMNNEFPEGSLLPPETKLAESLNASRVTLRQALSMLREDGLLKSVRGKGNIVTHPVTNALNGLERITHPIKLCCTQFPDEVEMESQLGLPTDYMKSVLKQESAAIMIAERWYKYQGGVIAYSVSFIPVEVAKQLKVNLADKSDLLDLLEKRAYNIAVSSTIEMKLANTSGFISNRYTIKKDQPIMMLSENLYFGEKYPYIYNKHYFITSAYNICVNGVQGDKFQNATGKT